MMNSSPVRKLLLGAAMVIVSANCAVGQQDALIEDWTVKVTHYEPPFYPNPAHAGSREGVVVIRIKMDSAGKVIDAVALSGYPDLIVDTLDNAKKWQFEPNARKTAILVYDFRIVGTCTTNNERGDAVFHPPNFTSVTSCRRLPSLP